MMFCNHRALNHHLDTVRCARTGPDTLRLTDVLYEGLRLSPPRPELPPVNISGQHYVDDATLAAQDFANVPNGLSYSAALGANPLQTSSGLSGSISHLQVSQEPEPRVGAPKNQHLSGPISRYSGQQMPRDPTCPRCGDRSSVTETECER